jgi:hypothetical protein
VPDVIEKRGRLKLDDMHLSIKLRSAVWRTAMLLAG